MGRTLSQLKMEKKMSVHWVHCQPLRTATNDPMTGLKERSQHCIKYSSLRDAETYPNEGPRKGLRMYMVVPIARSDGWHVSAMVPAPMARAGEKNMPARNLRMTSAAKFGANPAPRVKMAPSGGDIRYTVRRP